MAISNQHTVPTNDQALRLQLFRILEGARTGVYLDTAQDAHPTIGIGFNLDDDDVRNRVFTRMRIPLGSEHRVNLAAIIALPGINGDLMQQALNAYLAEADTGTWTPVPELGYWDMDIEMLSAVSRQQFTERRRVAV